MFLEPSIELLKKIRIENKITQKEVCYGIIDTSYLSHLESGRKELNKDILELLIDRYNLLSFQKKLNFKLNKNILLLSIEERRRVLFNALLKKIDKEAINTENLLNSFNNLFRYFTPEENSVLLHKFILIFYKESDWDNCLSYSMKFLHIKSHDKEYKTRMSQILLVYTVSVICSGNYKKIKEVEFLINKEINYFEEEISEKILVNTMNCFSRLNNPKKVFFFISIYNNIIKNQKFKKEKEHIEAICFRKNRQYEKSLKLYKKMLKEYADIETQLTCNIDITSILEDQGKIKNIPYRYNTVKALLEENISFLDIGDLRSTYYFIGEIAILLNKKGDAIYYFKLLLELEEKEHLEGYNIDKHYHAINYLITSTKKNDIPTIELLKRNILKFNKIEISSSTISAFVEFLTKSKNTDILLDFLNELNKKS